MDELKEERYSHPHPRGCQRTEVARTPIGEASVIRAPREARGGGIRGHVSNYIHAYEAWEPRGSPTV